MPTSSPPTMSGCDRDSSPHLPHCPLIRDVSVETLPHLPTDLASLIDQGFLHCWKSGVCLQHPRLFVLLSCAPDPNDPDRNLVVTEVSPCQQGRKVLSYVVDHIDTLVREWHQELANTDGYQPKVRQLIPCFVCERLGLEPHNFTFVQCQQQSSKADTICCPKHPRLQVDLHQVVPDIMLHDVDADLLLSHDDISYEDTDGNILGSGGYGKVIFHLYLNTTDHFGGEPSSRSEVFQWEGLYVRFADTFYQDKKIAILRFKNRLHPMTFKRNGKLVNLCPVTKLVNAKNHIIFYHKLH